MQKIQTPSGSGSDCTPRGTLVDSQSRSDRRCASAKTLCGKVHLEQTTTFWTFVTWSRGQYSSPWSMCCLVRGSLCLGTWTDDLTNPTFVLPRACTRQAFIPNPPYSCRPRETILPQLRGDLYTTGDYILHLDSDLVLFEEITYDHIFHLGKPVLPFRRYRLETPGGEEGIVQVRQKLTSCVGGNFQRKSLP